MRNGFLRKQWTVGTLAALGLGAMACSTTNSGTTDAQATQPEEAGLAEVAAAPTLEQGLSTVYFDLDSAVLRNAARSSLEDNAREIQSNPDWGIVTISGHCDERGSDEYNLALGERRAGAVKQFLSDLGVSPDRMKTLSYGEMKPATFGHDELAWRLNRRSEFAVED